MNYTTTDLKNMTSLIAQASHQLGLLGDADERLALDIGSKTYGRAYRLHVTNQDRGDGTRSSGHATFRPAGTGGYLGMTKNEAGLTLSAILNTLEAVAAMNRSTI